MLMIDATKWEEFYKKMTDGLKPYDHYDDGYRDAMDNVDDWMDGNQVEAEPVRHGRWIDGNPLCPVCGENKFKGLDADIWADWKPRYCPNCGADMREASNEKSD